MTKYDTIEGTAPSEEVQHQSRVITRTEDDGMVYMMTEVEDGVFVQWSQCHSCSQSPAGCTCKTGPVLPPYIAKWRDQRFEKSIRHRKSTKPETQDDDAQAEYDNAPELQKVLERASASSTVKRTRKRQEPADQTAETVDDGLDAALAAAKAAKEEEKPDVGF